MTGIIPKRKPDPIEKARLALSRRVRVHTRRLDVLAFEIRRRDLSPEELAAFSREAELVRDCAATMRRKEQSL